jgi:tetratricopeptide (TPR) repeat protein
LFCICAVNAQAHDVDSVLYLIDSLRDQPEKAVEIINTAMAENPDSEELLKARADFYENMKQYDKAVADYKRLTQLSPDDENLWYLLGRNQYNDGQLQDAMKSFNRSTKLNSKYVPAFNAKVQTLLQLNQNEAALKVSDSTLNIGETALTYFLQGEIHSKLKSWQKAEWAYQSATKIDRGYIDAYLALANIALNHNKASEAREAANAALRIDPDSKEAMIARSRGLALSRRYDYAIEDISYVINLDPNNANAYYLRGTYYNETNKPIDAVKDFEMLLTLQPDNWQAMAGQANAYANMGDKEKARDGYLKLLTLAANYPEKDAIVKMANQQIFELNREKQAPVVILTSPIPEYFNIYVHSSQQTLTINGKIIDESPVKYIKINGQNIQPVQISDYYEFVALVKLENVQEIYIEASDVYDNITKVAYLLIKNENP